MFFIRETYMNMYRVYRGDPLWVSGDSGDDWRANYCSADFARMAYDLATAFLNMAVEAKPRVRTGLCFLLTSVYIVYYNLMF